MRYLVAADTGGTFTDLVVHDVRDNRTEFGKTLTNYQDLMSGVMEGLRDTSATLDDAGVLKHGTTHVVNAFVQRIGTARFEELVQDLSLPPDFSLETMNHFIDWNRNEPFQVIRGEGECAV